MEPTYKMIGGDGREYGPASLEELLTWTRDGRVAATTRVWRSDEERWRPAAEVAELQPVLPQLPSLPEVTAADDMVPVGFWVRAAALMIDQLVLGIPLSLIVEAPEFLRKPLPDPQVLMRHLPELFAYSGIIFIVSGFYYILLTGRFGATVGKMIFRAQVVRVDGSPVGYAVATGRYFASLLSRLILGIGYLFVVFRPDKRALHDLVAGTRVVYRRS